MRVIDCLERSRTDSSVAHGWGVHEGRPVQASRPCPWRTVCTPACYTVGSHKQSVARSTHRPSRPHPAAPTQLSLPGAVEQTSGRGGAAVVLLLLVWDASLALRLHGLHVCARVVTKRVELCACAHANVRACVRRRTRLQLLLADTACPCAVLRAGRRHAARREGGAALLHAPACLRMPSWGGAEDGQWCV